MKKFLCFILGFLCCLFIILSIDIKHKHQYYKLKNNINENTILKNETIKISIPIESTMVPQGFNILNNYFIFSSYDYQEKENSVIYVTNNQGNIINKCKLDIIAHVGGIAYSKTRKSLFIAANGGYINEYSIVDILSKNQAKNINSYNVGYKLFNYRNKNFNEVSFLTIHNNKLYLGSFSLLNKGLMKVYNLDKDLTYIQEFTIPNKVQGVSFYKDKIIFSLSYGRNNPSYIVLCDFNDNFNYKKSKKKVYQIDPMSEQIAVYNDTLLVTFESGSKLYYNCYKKNQMIQKINLV